MLKIPELTPGQQRLWRTLQFLVRLLVLSLPLYLVIFLTIDLSVLQITVAGQSAHLLRALGWTVSQNGALLTAGNFTFFINQDCTGWKSMLFLFALLFATPGPLFEASAFIQKRASKTPGKGKCPLFEASAFIQKRASKTPREDIRKRLLGLMAGILIIWLGNLGRILGTVYIQAIWGTETALLVHDWGWQLGLVVLVLAIWVCWMKLSGFLGAKE